MEHGKKRLGNAALKRFNLDSGGAWVSAARCVGDFANPLFRYFNPKIFQIASNSKELVGKNKFVGRYVLHRVQIKKSCMGVL